MISIDYSVWLQIVSFLIFWFLVNKLLFKPYIGLLEKREESTEGARAEAVEITEEADRLKLEYDRAIAEATLEAQAIKDTICYEAAREREQILNQASEEALRHLQLARSTIQREFERELQQAAHEAETLGRAMAEKILGRQVS
jgi:F-type H+-transporting ATPase subunit b